MPKTKLYPVFSLLVALSVLATGCAAPKPAALTDAQVVEVAENILLALDTSDYAAFTRDFSADMLAAFTEDQFTQLRDLLQNASGNYLSMHAPRLSNSRGYAIYRFPCKFDNEDVIVTITFSIGGDKVEGLFFDSPNLRNASQ